MPRRIALIFSKTGLLPAPPADPVQGLTKISLHFSAEVKAVDPNHSILPVIDPTYGDIEWSYNGLTVTGGTWLACEHGASELLYAMGFRWITPDPRYFIRPPGIQTGLVRGKTKLWMPYCSWLHHYSGNNWAPPLAHVRTKLDAQMNKWLILHNWKTAALPAGHRWQSIILANQAYFNAHPEMLKADKTRYELTVPEPAYSDLVMINAAQLLKDGFNEWTRTNFDPTDADNNPSNLVYPFTKAVADKVRSGTTAIPGLTPGAPDLHPARPGVPNAQIGIYAYAEHRLPPIESVSPGVYTQVAMAFNDTGLTYLQLVQQHAAKCDFISIREYLGVQDWFNSKPFLNSRLKRGTYFDSYDNYVASGAIGAVHESSSNWLTDMVGFQYGIRKLKTGTFSWDAALDDVMPVFNNDPKVRELLEYWGDRTKTFGDYYLRVAMEIIDGMADDWYKIHFQRYMTIMWEREKLPPKNPGAVDDPFPDAACKLYGWVSAVAEDEIVHSYAIIRQETDFALLQYPALRFSAQPPAPWMSAPWLVKPTADDFAAALEELQELTYHDPVLDDTTDLVLAKDIVPAYNPAIPPAPAGTYGTRGVALYVFVVESGQGTITFVQTLNNSVVAGGTNETFAFGPGTYFVSNPVSQVRVTWSGGYLFLDTFPFVDKHPTPSLQIGGGHWLYVPQRYAGVVNLVALVNWRFFDESGMLNLVDSDEVGYVSPANLGPGHVYVEKNNTHSRLFNYNCCRYLSPDRNVALLPRIIAEEEELSYVELPGG